MPASLDDGRNDGDTGAILGPTWGLLSHVGGNGSTFIFYRFSKIFYFWGASLRGSVACWGRLGGLLGRLENHHSSKWGPKREVFGIPKRPWAVLKALGRIICLRVRSGGLLGEVWGGLFGRLESQDGSKLVPKREVSEVLKRSENGYIIGILLRSIFS